MTNNVTLTQGSTTVTIHTIKVEEDFSGNPIVLMLPSPLSGSDAVTKFLNLNRVKRVLTITGYLKDNVASGVTAATERDNLRDIASTNTSIDCGYITNTGNDKSKTMGDDTLDSTWTMMKCRITEVPTDETTTTIYQVMVQLMEGTNLSG